MNATEARQLAESKQTKPSAEQVLKEILVFIERDAAIGKFQLLITCPTELFLEVSEMLSVHGYKVEPTPTYSEQARQLSENILFWVKW